MLVSDAPCQQVVLEKFELYSTKSHYYLVGHDKAATAFRLLKLSRLEAELEASSDPCTYTKAECTALLRRIRDGNIRIGGLQSVCRAAGLIGCFRFLEGFYLLLVTQRRYHGTVCGQKVYGIDKTLLVPLVQPSVDIIQGQGRETAAEKRYRKLLLSGLELNKDFYFSYTYNLARTLQANLTAEAPSDPFDSMFVWNEYLSRPLRQALNSSSWVIPLIHGFWQQRSLALFGRSLTVTLIARRSKYFAGTRYLKRGVNFKGQVANDVEAEQLVDAGMDRRSGLPELASIVQVRGSIPLYWNQEGVTHLKPDITLQHYDPLYTATRLHFKDLSARYGHPVVVLNLVKSAEKRPRETILRKEFAIAIAYINQQAADKQRISYIPWDFNYHAKQRSSFILADMASVIRTGLDATGFFFIRPADDSSAPQGQTVQLQHGVLRTNCIDCLDRTNVAQFAHGLTALGQQLHALGLADTPSIEPQSSAARELMDMYEDMGNVLSRQYGGSEAHSTFFQRQRGDWEAATQSRDLMTSIRRFYSNAYTDAEKQDAINLFLGNFVPQHGHAALWELDSDYFLHAGQQFSKPPGRANATPNPSASAPAATPGGQDAERLTSMTGQAEDALETPIDDELGQSADAQVAESPSRDGHGQDSGVNPAPWGRESVVLPQMEDADLQGLQQVGAEGQSNTSSEGASALLRDQVKQTVADASEVNHSPNPPPSSPPRTATIAVQPPASTSQQAFQRLAEADTASLGTSTSHRAEPDATNEASDQSLSACSTSEIAADDAGPSSAGIDEMPSHSGGPDKAPSAPQQLPTNLSMLQFAQQSEAKRYQNKTKLESFDKIIGRAPNTPHHVSLQAAPTQKAYLPHWLASPLGMHAPHLPRGAPTGVQPKDPGTASLPASRFTTEDTEVNFSPSLHRNLHRDMSIRTSPTRQRQQQLHQADPNEPLTPLQPPPRGTAPHPGPNPFATPSHGRLSPDHSSRPPRPLTRAASDTTICMSNSIASLSPAPARNPPSFNQEADSSEGSFVSLHLQTVRPTAPKPYQTAHFGPAPPAVKGRGSNAAASGLQRARSLDTRPSSSSSSGAPSPGVASPPMRYPSFAGERAAQAHRHSSIARVGSRSKHAPGRRITFPSILPLFTPPSQTRASHLEPVKEGEQLSSSRASRPALPRRQSTTALWHQGVQTRQSMSRSLDLGRPGEEELKQGQLGMGPELAAWWGEQGAAGDMGGDPLQGWLRREQQARAVYKREDLKRRDSNRHDPASNALPYLVPGCSFLMGSQSPLDPFEQWALEDKYAKLCNFYVHISMDGFSQGAASEWRHTEGLRGSITCAEELLQDLASQCH